MRNTIGSLIWLNWFRKTHKRKTKIVKALIIVLALIFLSGIASGKRVEAHIIVSNYRFTYLSLESGPAQSTITLLKESSKAGTGRSVAAWMFWFGFPWFEMCYKSYNPWLLLLLYSCSRIGQFPVRCFSNNQVFRHSRIMGQAHNCFPLFFSYYYLADHLPFILRRHIWWSPFSHQCFVFHEIANMNLLCRLYWE